MEVKCYLTVTKNGSVRVTKNKPGLNWDEIAVGVSLDIPKQLFLKPQISASITIPEDAISPKEITAEVSDNIKEAIIEHTGLDVKIEVINTDN